MSIKIMNAVWELPLPPSEKLVLLSLADWANDDGWCHPSIATVARKCSVSERTVQRVIQYALAANMLERIEVSGVGCRYRLTPRQFVTPDNLSPPTTTTETPDTVSPNTSVTTIVSGAKAPSTPRARFTLPPDIPIEAWTDFEDMRRRIRKPMTDKARELAVKRLRELQGDGWPPEVVLNNSTLNSYQGLFPPNNRTTRNAAEQGSAVQRGAAKVLAIINAGRG